MAAFIDNYKRHDFFLLQFENRTQYEETPLEILTKQELCLFLY
jgi:hypothetical protein